MPATVNDAYLIRVSFFCKTSSNTGRADLKLDIGGTQNVIADVNIAFPKGQNTETPFTTTVLVFAGATFLANGGQLKVSSAAGTTSIYEINYVISRIHKGR